MAQRPFATDFQDRGRTLAVLPTAVASRSEIDSLTMWQTVFWSGLDMKCRESDLQSEIK